MLFSEVVNICVSILKSIAVKVSDTVNSEKELIDKISRRQYEHILVLDKYVPWTKYVVENEADIWFVVFPSARNKGEWNMQAVPVAIGSFDQRHSVPEEWWGGNKETLPTITGVKSASFCHKSNGFLTVAGNLEDILELAEIACSIK